MVSLSGEMFRMYDIRGVYNQDLTDELAYIIGKSLGTFFQENGQKKVAVGKDNRLSGEIVSRQTIKGLLETGCDVVFFGFVLNPMIYFSWYHSNFNAAVIVTASHNPPQYNGYKCSLNKKPLLANDYQKIKEICLSEKFKEGKGTKTDEEIWPAYKKNILSSVKLDKPLKVAADCGNGTAGIFAPEILKELGCEVIPIFCESDGSFPNHQPYPQKIEYYGKLIETIKKENCDLGLSFDGDGDRVGVYDERGNYIEADRLAMIFAADICRKFPSAKIVMNTSTSLSVVDYIKSLRGQFFFSKTGYPYVTEKMNELGAIFGGEISGHFFFKDKYFGYDDALYAGIRALEILSHSEKTFSEIIAELPRYFETREFRIEIPIGKDKFVLIEEIKKEITKEYPQIEIKDIDGVRFSFPDGWGLIRASNTEQLITGRAEAKSEERLGFIKEIIKLKLAKNGVNLDWEKVK